MLGRFLMRARELKMRKLILILALIVSSPVVAYAQAGTTLELLQGCELLEKSTVSEGKVLVSSSEARICWGFFRAVQVLSALADQKDQRLLGVCAPPDSSLLQYVRIFVNYARNSPAELHENIGLVVLKSLYQAFPCPKPN